MQIFRKIRKKYDSFFYSIIAIYLYVKIYKFLDLCGRYFFNLNLLKYFFQGEADREGKRLRSEVETVTRQKQSIELEMTKMRAQLKDAQNTSISAKMKQDDEARKKATEMAHRRMSLEEELQQMKEQSRGLEDKLARAEFDFKFKEVSQNW